MLMKSEITEFQTVAKLFEQSQYFSKTSMAQAFVRMLAGKEMGLLPFASMNAIQIVNGKPTISAAAVATLIENSTIYDYQVLKSDNDECVIEFFKNGKARGKTSFTKEEAQGAGLMGKDTYKNYRSDMLFARALTRGARRYCAGIFGGNPVYVPEELGMETDQDGNIITSPKEINQPADLSNQPDRAHEQHVIMESIKKTLKEARENEIDPEVITKHIFEKENVEDWFQISAARLEKWNTFVKERIEKKKRESLLTSKNTETNLAENLKSLEDPALVSSTDDIPAEAKYLANAFNATVTITENKNDSGA